MTEFLLGVCITCLTFVGIGIYYGWKLAKNNKKDYVVIEIDHED